MFKTIVTLASLAFTLASARMGSSLLNSLTDTSVLMPPVADNSTYGNTDQIRTTNVHMNVTVDFDTRTLDGWAYHTMEVVEATNIVQFDVWDLTIHACLFDGRDVPYSIL